MPAIKNSSNISHADHDPSTNEMTVRFSTGATYVHSNVPAAVATGIHTAPSAGSYYHAKIRGKFPTRPL